MNYQHTNGNPNPASTPVPNPQPTLSTDGVNALEAAIRSLQASVETNTAAAEATRQATEAGFERLVDELTAVDATSEMEEGTSPILVTPAATDRSETRTGERSQDRNRQVAPRNTSSSKRRYRNLLKPSESTPKKARGESDDDFLDRLWNLPSSGPKAKRLFESDDHYNARRHDGRSDD